jgi:hypothetical protein
MQENIHFTTRANLRRIQLNEGHWETTRFMAGGGFTVGCATSPEEKFFSSRLGRQLPTGRYLQEQVASEALDPVVFGFGS